MTRAHGNGENSGAASDATAQRIYRRALRTLNDHGARYIVGGAYAHEWVTGITRRTKDLDIFVRREDVADIVALLTPLGCETWIESPHWLAKASWGEDFIDIIFGAGNGQAAVDDVWFERAIPGEAFGVPVRFCPIEEALWTKAFIMERERYDGADVAHLLLRCSDRIDWNRLLWRFGSDWPVLLSHLILFRYIYPADAQRVPEWVVQDLAARLPEQTAQPPDVPLCRGGLLSRGQYLVDFEDWQYRDARIAPVGRMSRTQAENWSSQAVDPPHAKDKA
ncbi:MAG TPA: hypothetical protein VEB21_12370 [Terriglobales bacterium]|nr:hypothetical protein [Terriglobales bacterium]